MGVIYASYPKSNTHHFRFLISAQNSSGGLLKLLHNFLKLNQVVNVT